MKLLRRCGYAVVVVTNQAGVARGMVREQAVTEAYNEIQRVLSEVGEQLDGHYYCPHPRHRVGGGVQAGVFLSEPKPGMVLQAARDLELDLSRSVVVGDRWTDIQLARAVDAKAVLVRTGYGVSQLASPPTGEGADAVADNLLEAVGWIMEQTPGDGGS